MFLLRQVQSIFCASLLLLFAVLRRSYAEATPQQNHVLRNNDVMEVQNSLADYELEFARRRMGRTGSGIQGPSKKGCSISVSFFHNLIPRFELKKTLKD